MEEQFEDQRYGTVVAITPAMLSAALSGEKPALDRVMLAIAPVVRARIARVLAARASRRSREGLSYELDDLVQDVYAQLFEDDARVLRAWNPVLGLSLRNYVGMVAQRRALSILRSRRRSACAHEPIQDADYAAQESTPERAVATRELVRRLWQRIEVLVSRRGAELFQRLYLAEDTIAEVCAALGLSESAAYQWRSRLGVAARTELSNLGLSHPHRATRAERRALASDASTAEA